MLVRIVKRSTYNGDSTDDVIVFRQDDKGVITTRISRSFGHQTRNRSRDGWPVVAAGNTTTLWYTYVYSSTLEQPSGTLEQPSGTLEQPSGTLEQALWYP